MVYAKGDIHERDVLCSLETEIHATVEEFFKNVPLVHGKGRMHYMLTTGELPPLVPFL
jgi:hypothetical protein